MNLELSSALVDALARMGKSTNCDRVLIIGASEQPQLKSIRKKLIYATSQAHIAGTLEAAGYDVIVLPGLTASRLDRLKAAIVGAVSSGLVEKGQNLLCAMSRDEGSAIDTIMHITASDEALEHSSLVVADLETSVPPQLLEVVVNLALRIGREGYEGRVMGTLIVVGDSTAVMERSHPLTLNPFQGYSEAERNLFDTHVRDALRTFATLDGAFVVRDDGVVLAAGRHIQAGDLKTDLPLGLGARHTAAASVSAGTDAIAVSVSQSTGEVRVFQNGSIVLEIAPGGRRSGEPAAPAKVKLRKKATKARAEKAKGDKKKEAKPRRERRKTDTFPIPKVARVAAAKKTRKKSSD